MFFFLFYYKYWIIKLIYKLKFLQCLDLQLVVMYSVHPGTSVSISKIKQFFHNSSISLLHSAKNCWEFFFLVLLISLGRKELNFRQLVNCLPAFKFQKKFQNKSFLDGLYCTYHFVSIQRVVLIEVSSFVEGGRTKLSNKQSVISTKNSYKVLCFTA